MAPKILWPMGRVPPVEPPCGFDDEHCRLTLNPGLVSALAVLASILVIAVVFASRWVGTLGYFYNCFVGNAQSSTSAKWYARTGYAYLCAVKDERERSQSPYVSFSPSWHMSFGHERSLIFLIWQERRGRASVANGQPLGAIWAMGC